MNTNEIYSITLRTTGAFGFESSHGGHIYYFVGPDFSSAFQIVEKIYSDISNLVDRTNVKLSKGFEKKVAACSSEILIDMENKIKILKKTTVEFHRFSLFTRDSILAIIEMSRDGQNPANRIAIFQREFLRQLENLILSYMDRQNAMELETYEQKRHMLHDRNLDPKHLRIVECFYSDFAILKNNIGTFFNHKLRRSFMTDQNGIKVNFVTLLLDFEEIIDDLASVIVEVEQASKA
ncbi:hypothetical protein ACFELO_00350 [Oceanicaulis sp. LC35]|uniref:hypothetical protein n=1 Tax=Oceanicaulis sp. LC35 TaxID=3349635 RepID=UPI003F858847